MGAAMARAEARSLGCAIRREVNGLRTFIVAGCLGWRPRGKCVTWQL